MPAHKPAPAPYYKDQPDAIARQYAPDAREAVIMPDELTDPIGDEAYSPVKGIVHRYPDRVLLKITDTCHHYCRFCFRKEMVGGGDGMLTPAELEAALAYVAAAPQVREVILTGGDPLTLSARRLCALFDKLETVPYLNIIRLHTRAPLTNPETVNDALISLFERTEKALYMVLHVNHVQELTEGVRHAIRKLNRAGVVLLSQSVLLKGVNDDPAVLETLFRALVSCRVKPYYLHHLDKAPGTSHFRVSIKRGQDILKSLQGRLSGLALPRYMLEIPGGFGKMPIDPRYIAPAGNDDTYTIEDHKGTFHRYKD